jgi:hypothetical protein
MIIGNFDRLSAIRMPLKTDTPLFVDPDGVLPLTVWAQGLQVIGRRNSQIFEGRRGMKKGYLGSNCLSGRHSAVWLVSRAEGWRRLFEGCLSTFPCKEGGRLPLIRWARVNSGYDLLLSRMKDG